MTGIDSNINVVGSSSVAQMGVASTGNLTPDALMVYMQTRLSSLDAQIDEVFEKQQHSEKLRGLGGELQTTLASAKFNEDGSADLTDPATQKVVSDLSATLSKIEQIDPRFADSLRRKMQEPGGILEGTKKHQLTANSAAQAAPLPSSFNYDDVRQGNNNSTNPMETKSSDNQVGLGSGSSTNGVATNHLGASGASSAPPAARAPANGFGEQSHDSAKKLIENAMKDLESGAQMDMIKLQSIMSARQTAVQLSTNLIASLGESTKGIASNTR